MRRIHPGRGADEAAPLLSGRPAEPQLDRDEERLAGLAARGLNASQIARELGVSLRVVQYRLAKLRRRVGVESTAELVARLARSGFE